MTDFFADSTPAADRNFTVSDSAVKRIAFLIEQEEGDGLFLRVSVSGGGCSGFQYGFTFDDEQSENDSVIEFGGLKVYVDAMSNMYLEDVKIDYLDSLEGSGFKIDNPKATGTCGCGHSFSV